MTPHVVGIDPSLTSTGIAHVAPGGRVTLSRVRSKGRAGASWYERGERLLDLAARIDEHLALPDPAVVVIEAPAYAAASTSVHDRAGLWWDVWHAARGRGHTVVAVTPSQRMVYATGTGRADKDRVLAAVIRRYVDVDVSGNDEADALVFAAIGRRLVGAPIEESLPAAHARAMRKIALPGGKD